MGIRDKKTKKKLAILEVLKTSSSPLSGTKITDALAAAGQDISERSVRLYLHQLDAEGLTENRGKRGRLITDKGRDELGASTVLDRLGYMSAHIDQVAFRMSFDLATRSGTVIVNTTFVERRDLLRFREQICQVYAKGYAMGTLVSLLEAGEQIGDITVPEGMLGFCTVCSVTLNGVLLKHGVPTRSLFSGLLDLRNGEPKRFTELINYDGTSVDPLELFIKSRMTNYMSAITTGNGLIGAGFREVPAECYDLVVSLADKLDRIGLGAFLRIGRPGRALFNIPVREGCCGAVVIGGLNPVSIFEENHIRISCQAISGLMDFHRLFPYHELEQRL